MINTTFFSPKNFVIIILAALLAKFIYRRFLKQS